MLSRLHANARRLGREAATLFRSLQPCPDLEEEIRRLFQHGPFPSRPTAELRTALEEFYRRGLGLPAPRLREVHSLQRAAEVFQDGPRLGPKAALLLASLGRPGTLHDQVSAWRQRMGPVWDLPRAYQPVSLALWPQTLGLVSPCSPRWLFHARAGRGGLLEQLAGRVLECGCWCAWLRADEVVALRAPTALRVDEQGQLHSVGGASLEWADGRRFWAIHGEVLPDDFDPAAVTYAGLLSTRQPHREAIIDILGYEWLLAEAPCRLVDLDLEASGYPRRLVEVPMPDENVMVVVVTCPSTGKNAYLRVPPEMRSCRQAVAWTFAVDQPDSYQPWQQT